MLIFDQFFKKNGFHFSNWEKTAIFVKNFIEGVRTHS